jgi:hypothetical protein
MISYLQAVNVIKTFADQHLQVNKFDFEFKEQMQNLATLNEAYPFVYVVPVASDTIANVNEFDVEIYCVDRLQKDRSNVNYVISDCNQILNDLVLWLEEGQNDIEIVGTATQTPINNDLLDYVGGWVLRVRLQVEKIGLCEIPLGETPPPPPPPSCEDAIYQNSEGTFIKSIPSGGTFTSEDILVELFDSSGTLLIDGLSLTNIDISLTAPDATIQINNRTFGTAKSNETKNFSLTTAKLMATGQTTSYATGDDGNLQQGRSFTTLLENNPFGNTNRFTALNGTQTYLNDIVLDWSTWDGQTVLGWYRIPLGTAITWANALSGANAFNIIGYSGWRLPNVNELMSIGLFSQIDMYNYAPFNILNKIIWTSTTALGNTLNAYRTPSTGFMTNGVKTSTFSTQCYIPCRNFTNAELGI